MIEMSLTLRLLSPLSLHRTRTGVQYVETLDYIPGAAIRGALAEAYLVEHGQPDNRFNKLFLSGGVQYGDLWPASQHGASVLIPASAQACKRYGLKGKHKGSFRDALLDGLAGLQNDRECNECGEPLDHVGGYLSDLETLESVAARSRLRVNTAIERGTGSVAREMLFTQHTLIGKRQGKDEDVIFRGLIRVTDPNLLSKLNSLMTQGTFLFLGAGRSRGLGETEVTSWQADASGEPLTERWKQFNIAAQRAGGNPNTRYFSLTLLSHLVLRDGLLRPVLDNIAPQHFGLPSGVEWVRYPDSGFPVRFLDKAIVPGWNAAQGLPKPDAVALARRSVMLFQCDASFEQAVIDRLMVIEAEGIGERREEGFGRIAVCYPIHYKRWRE